MLTRPHPIHNESLQSYIYRLCRRNGWHYDAFKSHMSKLVAPLHSTKKNQRQSIVNYLQDKTKHENVAHLIDVWQLAGNYRSSLDMARVKVCTSCLKNSEAIPAYWYLKSYLVCGTHKQLMIDTCTNCDTQISHDSYIAMACKTCGLQLQDNESTKLQVDRFSGRVHNIFALINKDMASFESNLKGDIKAIESELSVLHSIVELLSKKSKHKRDNRRFSSIIDLYQKQLKCSQISENENVLRAALWSVIKELYEGGHYDIGYIITPIMPYLNDPGSQHIFDVLRDLVINPPEGTSELRVGVKWLEKLFGLEKGVLVFFAKTQLSDYLIKSQGSPSLLVSHVDYLINRFRLIKT